MFHGMGTALFHWIQSEHIMVFGQEQAGSICQLWGPGIQATQVQFIKEFTKSLPNSQSGGMGILGLISPLQQLHFFRGFGHMQCCYHPGHQGFLLEGLQVCSVVPYHHYCFFTALPQLGVCVLYSEALWQRAIFCLQGLYHDVDAFSHVRPSCFHWYDVGKRRAVWSLHPGCTLTGHSHLDQVPPSGHHLPPQLSFYASIGVVLP